MEIKVFGLGYVGTVTALSLSSVGHQVVGIEPSREKVKALQEGKLHIYEPGLENLLEKSKGFFKTQNELGDSVGKENIFIICVGTPMAANGAVNLSQVESVFKELAPLIEKGGKSLVLLRSTVPPGTCESLYTRYLSAIAPEKFDFLFYPEFLREGDAVKDFQTPRLFSLGQKEAQKDVSKKWNSFFEILPGYSEVKWVSWKSSEMIKYAQNSYNALRVSFANELGSICHHQGVSLDEMHELLKAHNKNENDGMYLKPGFSFGGPCLTKEIEALCWMGRHSTYELPLINEIVNSNEKHFERFLMAIESSESKKILFAGATFKEDTDDLRHSLVLKLVELLVDRPSYLQKRELTIIDSKPSLKRLKEVTWLEASGVKLIGLDELNCADYDLVVKGPFPIPKSKLEELKKISLIDLGFHRSTEGFNFSF